MELHDLRSFEWLKQKDFMLAGQVESVYNLTLETINGISRFYDNYTMHDMNHGLRVAAYMEELAFGIDDDFYANLEQFNPFEVSLMLLCAILHDIGMFVRPEDERAIRNNEIKYTNSLTFNGVLKVSKNEEEAVKEIIRLTHAARISEFLDYDINGKKISEILQLKGLYAYADDIALICRGHGEDYNYIKNLRTESTKGDFAYNQQYLAVLLRIADYLDLDRQRTPILWYSIMGIEGFSREEWEKHFIIQNEKKLRHYIDGKMQIYFDGRSSNAKIHRRYLAYIDDLRNELENADNLLNTRNTEKKYAFHISTKLEDCVQTEGFKYSDLRLNLDYSSITELLMGRNIYGDNKLGLRELIQNSIDACELMKEIRNSDPDIDPDITIPPAIYVTFSKKNNYVKVKDTGIGMTLEVVKKHFLNVGKSYYKSSEFMYEDRRYQPIGQFGIGFLACFLLSDNVIVKTKYYKNHEINQIELEKDSEYVVTNIQETANFVGTEITLDYEKFFDVFKSEEDVASFIEKYFYTTIPINIRNDDVPESTRRIENSCEKQIKNMIEKDNSKNRYETIDCSKYSKSIQGILGIKPAPKKRDMQVTALDSKNTYVYREESKTFELLDELSDFSDGYYRLIEYSAIDYEDYLSLTRAKRAKKRDAIRALTEEQDKKKILLIHQQEIVDCTAVDEEGNEFMKINGEKMESILAESGMPYYKELFDVDYIDTVFIVNKQYIYLQNCVLHNMWKYHLFKELREMQEFFFYNKGIYISRLDTIICTIPYAAEVIGCTNYIGKDVKLDVSRNSVIFGMDILMEEFTEVLLKYFLEKEEDPSKKMMVEKMLASLQIPSEE